MKNVYDCNIIFLPKFTERSGNISVVNNLNEIPFETQRIFYLYDIPGGESRGGHSHINCHQFLVAISGSFEVLLNDGKIQRQVLLNRPNIGLHIPPGVWASEVNFSSGSVCLVLASELYDENDYIRDFETYNKLMNETTS